MKPSVTSSKPHTRIAILGDEFWIQHLARGLRVRHGDDLIVEDFPTSGRAARTPGVMLALLRSDVTLRVGLVGQEINPYDPIVSGSKDAFREAAKRVIFSTRAGLALRRAVLYSRLWFAENASARYAWLIAFTRRLHLRRTDFMYWIGSDVSLVLQRFSQDPAIPGRWTGPNAPRSLTVAHHLSEELQTVGIQSTVLPFPKPLPAGPIPPLPPRFTVLAYLPTDRFDFYGGPSVLEAARRLEDVDFRIIGGLLPEGTYEPINVTVCGMQTDMYSVYADTTVLVRLTGHDGCPSTVAEALSLGRYVIHSYRRPYCVFVAHGDTEALVCEIAQLKAQHDIGSLPLQREAAEWARHEYDPDVRFRDLHRVLTRRDGDQSQ